MGIQTRYNETLSSPGNIPRCRVLASGGLYTERAKAMKLYAVESTNRMEHCQINARNCYYYTSRKKAENKIICKVGLHFPDVQIAFDKELDRTVKVYDAKKGNAETADALYFLTQIDVK